MFRGSENDGMEGVLRRTQTSKALAYVQSVVPAVQPRILDVLFQFLRWMYSLYEWYETGQAVST